MGWFKQLLGLEKPQEDSEESVPVHGLGDPVDHDKEEVASVKKLEKSSGRAFCKTCRRVMSLKKGKCSKCGRKI